MQRGEMYIDETVVIDEDKLSEDLRNYIKDIHNAFFNDDILEWDTLMEPFGGFIKEEYNENKISSDTYQKLKERYCVC